MDEQSRFENGILEAINVTAKSGGTRLEQATEHQGLLLASIAISLKRIADAMEPMIITGGPAEPANG